MNPFVGYDNIIPLLAPQDIGGTVTASSYMNLKYVQRGAFLVAFGAITSATATDAEVVTVEAATAEGGTEVAISFRYRLSGALGANTCGAVTTAATTGVSMAETDDNKLLWIEIDPAEVQAELADATVVRVKLTDTPDMTACLVGVLGFSSPRYFGTTHKSATASASA